MKGISKEWISQNRSLLLLLLFTALLYLPSLSFDFTNWDDRKLIAQNPLTLLSFSTLVQLFTETYWLNYMPLTHLSFALERSLFGLSSSVVHFNNVLLHMLNVALVYTWIRKLTRGQAEVAFFVAALFAVHPLRSESVVWAAERKDLLYSLFYLLALIRYTDYVIQEKSRFWVLSLLFFLLSCLSKGMAVSLSLAVVLIDVYLNRSFSWKSIGDKIPFFALSLTFGWVAVSATGTQDQVAVDAVYTWMEKIQLAGLGYWTYVWQHFWPFDLSPIHPFPSTINQWYWVFPIAAIALGGVAIFQLRRYRALFFGLGFFTINLIFVLQLYATNNSFVADHYTYLASIGMFFIWARAILHFKNRFDRFKRTNLQKMAWMIALCLALLTWSQNQIWQNSETLWTRAIEVYPEYWKGYLSRGQFHLENWDFERSTPDLSKAYELNPRQEIVALTWAQNLIYTRTYDEAGQVLKKRVEENPNEVKPWSLMASLATELNANREAVNFARQAIALNPEYSPSYYYLGCAQLGLGELDSAKQSFTRQIELNPLESARSYQMRAFCYNQQSNYEQAFADLQESIRIDPNFAKAHLGLGDLLWRWKKDRDRACQAFQKAADLGNEQAKTLVKEKCKG